MPLLGAAGAAFALVTSLTLLAGGLGSPSAAAARAVPPLPLDDSSDRPAGNDRARNHVGPRSPLPRRPQHSPHHERPPRSTTPARTAPPVTSRRLPSTGPVAPLAPAATVTTTSTTTTTIAAIGGKLPAAPVTLPLTTKGSNAHVNPLFAWLSGIGFLVAILVIFGRFLTSRPKRTRAGA